MKQQSAVENGQTDNPPDELEIVEMLWVNTGVRVDLEGVVIMSRILEQAVKGVKHLMGEKEKELSG